MKKLAKAAFKIQFIFRRDWLPKIRDQTVLSWREKLLDEIKRKNAVRKIIKWWRIKYKLNRCLISKKKSNAKSWEDMDMYRKLNFGVTVGIMKVQALIRGYLERLRLPEYKLIARQRHLYKLESAYGVRANQLLRPICMMDS